MQGFSSTVYDCGLQDLGFLGEQFTWEKFRGTDNWVKERLDRGLATQTWIDMFPDAVVKVIELSTSDHLPLFLDLNRKVYVQKRKRFRFENVWIREKDCYNLINDCWQEEGHENIIDKITRCCIKLEEWGGGMVKEMRDKLAFFRTQMRRFRARRDDYGVRQYNSARWEYLCLLDKKEVYWQQRAKQFWLTEGDHNTRFFHKYASNQRKNNMLKGLENSNRVWKEEDSEVQGIIVDYCTNLFHSSIADGRLTNGDTVRTISDAQNQSLLIPITAAEVKDAVFAMHPDKSPGPDGLNLAFFQTYWSIVGADVVQFCKSFFCSGVLPGGKIARLYA